MLDVVIDNPILNSPYLKPNRHFRFSDEGITDQIVNERRTRRFREMDLDMVPGLLGKASRQDEESDE